MSCYKIRRYERSAAPVPTYVFNVNAPKSTHSLNDSSGSSKIFLTAVLAYLVLTYLYFGINVLRAEFILLVVRAEDAERGRKESTLR